MSYTTPQYKAIGLLVSTQYKPSRGLFSFKNQFSPI